MKKLHKCVRYTVAILCQYEAIAIFTDPDRDPDHWLPTITELNRRVRHHKIATVVLSGLAWHFFARDWPFNTAKGE